MQRHLAAVMFTDLVGYTSTVQQNEEAGREVRARHRSIVEGALADHGGTLLQYFGDGSLSIFPSAVEAVAAANEIQKLFLDIPDAQLRIGIELGDIAYDVQGVYGNAVNVAARLEALSEPGGVLVSEKIWHELRNHPEFDLEPLGEVNLRNVEGPVSIFALRDEGLSVPAHLPGKTPEEPAPGPRAHHSPAEVAVDGIWERLRPRDIPREAAGAADLPDQLPLVGRAQEMAKLRSEAEKVMAGMGRTLLLTGDRGVGKSRLATLLADELLEAGWIVARGQAYPTDLGVPFSPFSDAFGPLLGGLDQAEIQVLTEGGTREMAALWPPLAQGGPREREPGSGNGEARSRLFWIFSRFLGTLAEARPLLLILEDLQWADESSLDLLHFIARQNTRNRVLVLCPFCEAEADPRGRLRLVIPSLERNRSAQRIPVGPLSRNATEELVTNLFSVAPTVVNRFVQGLYDWTRGNSFFLEGTLRGLVETGQLRKRDGRWFGWEVQEWELPQTNRDAVLLRMDRLPSEARKVAALAAVLGKQVTFEALKATTEEPEAVLVEALHHLTQMGVLIETEMEGEVVYGFSHPLLSETIEGELSLAVTRGLHGRIAGSLEALFGDRADEHADELAYHFVRAHGDTPHGKAVRYLTAAGKRALDRNAHSEAARYLEAALGRDPEGGETGRGDLLKSLARARIGVGDPDGAIVLWNEALLIAREDGDHGTVPGLFRRIGKAHVSRGRLESALQAFQRGKAAARRAEDPRGEARLSLAEGICLQQAGRSSQAKTEVDRALEIAVRLDDPSLVAKVNRGLLLIHLWNGDLSLVREMGLHVRAMAADTADPLLMFWSEWTLAVTDGLRGDTEGLRRRVVELERLADKMRSPSLQLWATELSLEYAYASGNWNVGIGIGEQAVSLGKALHEDAILPRLLVSLSLIYLARGDVDRAGELVDEAWDLSGADGVAAGVDLLNVHAIVPAHIGRAAYHNAREEWHLSIQFGEAGLEVADRTGYVTWGIHRLLPLLGEAYLQNRRMPEAEAAGRRLRTSGESLDNDLARAWASAAEGILAWLKGDPVTGVSLLREGAELLEEIPMVFEGTRVRRQLAGRLWEMGRKADALLELQKAYRVFRDLGARHEVQSALDLFQEMGSEPPAD